MVQDYYLGLDIGTGSLGWAVTDSNYQILKKHGKMLWGVRLFESAKTAEERRTFRTARRCLDRKNWRIKILQELFADATIVCEAFDNPEAKAMLVNGILEHFPEK